ncbi:hypothetical protein [Pseudomonas chlororaphis]|uniref:YobI family P-loop NTPase n=1 Tax=Pseudomonas chlororaphis TaxID=587753 RepID=UPI000F575925|nr:hypothetical protein [Pseudomonas chlororaphis]QLL10663.1 hypothetical protein H0I86_16470 [Pseudomonas chlororaphis subsp. aurantiaca]UVE42877.1 KAP family NTPase [Pseudomonas chlororaphis]
MLSRIKRNWMALSIGSRAAVTAFSAARRPANSLGSFEPLTPVLLEDKGFKRYEEELLKGLQNKEVLNIAVTGGYGAGKSSVLKTFLERHPEFPHALVSLATFSETKPSPSKFGTSIESVGEATAVPSANIATTPPTPDLMNRIEETIVQQLLYSVPASKLPKTRLKRIVQASGLAVYLHTVLLICLLASVLRFCLPSIEKRTDVEVKWLVDGLNAIPEWLAIGCILGSGIYLLYSGLRFISMFSIDGLTLKGGKLEATHHGSVLHKNVDEIIYCFERSDIRVVVIEDLDRFDTQDIFFRLREINFTICQSPQVRRPVHFIYAIRDELFTVTDKTKFFDLIIPIIPVVNSENSREKLNELMRSRAVGEAVLGAKLDPAVVETVCYYVDEMRLIKNIVNEYDIYSSLLANDGLELNPNKLFAIVVLRNLHPEAYAELLKRRGAIHSVLAGFQDWVKRQVVALQGEIEMLRENLTRKQAEVAKSVTELRVCFWFEIINRANLERANRIRCDQSSAFTLPTFVGDDAFAIVTQSRRLQPVLQLENYGPSEQGGQVDLKQALEAFDYQARAARLEQSFDDLEEEITQLLKQVTRLKTIPFREAVKDGYSDVVAVGLQGLEVVIYLMRKGLLDTDYVDYLGYFYEGSITQADKNFILAMTRGEVLDVATVLDDPERVLSKLDVDAMDAGRGLIANVIKTLARHRDTQFVEQARLKLATIFKSAHARLERFAEAMELIVAEPGDGKTRTVQALLEIDQHLILQLLKSERFQPNHTRAGLICTFLDTLTEEQIAGMKDRQGLLLKAINALPNVAELVPQLENPFNGWKWLRSKPAQFDSLNETTDATILRKLVELGCLKLSIPMLKLVMVRLANAPLTDSPVTYQGLLSLELAGFADQVKQMPDAFVDELLSQQQILPESESSLVTLLDYCQPDQKQMEALLTFTDCKISDLEPIPHSLWIRLLEDDRIEPVSAAAWTFLERRYRPDESAEATEENGVNTEALAAIQEAFLQYVNRHAEALGRTLWEGDEDDQRALQRFFLQSATISNTTLRSVFQGVNLSPEVVLNSNISATRWAYIAYNSTVPYTPKIHSALVRAAGNLEGAYIQHRWTVARDILDLDALPIKVVHEVSRNGRATLEDTLRMWAGISFDAYPTCEGATVELAKVCGHANAQGARFKADYLSVLVQIAQVGDLEREERVEVVIQALALNGAWEQIVPALDLLDSAYLKLAKSGKVVLPTAGEDRRLVEALQGRGFVSSKKFEDKRTVAYGKPSAIRAALGSAGWLT